MCTYVCGYVFVSVLGNECVWAMPPVCVCVCVCVCVRACACVCVRVCMPMLNNDSCVLFVGVGV